MAQITYATLMAGTQNAVYACLRADATLATLTKNIFSGVPDTSIRGVGLPFVRVLAPKITENQNTFLCYMQELPVDMEVYTTKESNIWPIVDAIRAALRANQIPFRLQNNLLDHELISSGQSHEILDELENKPMYFYQMK